MRVRPGLDLGPRPEPRLAPSQAAALARAGEQPEGGQARHVLAHERGGSVERERLVRRARLLAWLGVGWHGIEATVAVGAGLAAGSIALIGFGVDSLIESVAGIIVLWRFAASRAASEEAERRAQKLIALSFYVLV